MIFLSLRELTSRNRSSGSRWRRLGHCLYVPLIQRCGEIRKNLVVGVCPVAEQAVITWKSLTAETHAGLRRKFCFYYFVEELLSERQGKTWSWYGWVNGWNPLRQNWVPGSSKLLEVVRDTPNTWYKSKEIVFYFNRRVNAVIKAHRTDVQPF
jgi:ATP-dependent DNA helicase RecQ